jgi:predicted CXXCH cytochrome family protein
MIAIAQIAGVAALIAVGGEALAQIANSKHNLGSSAGPAGRNQTSNTEEICVFCHTPHGADTTAPAPLWNKSLASLPRTGTYQTYAQLNSSTIDGEILPVGSVSVACLSCHDGTQAMDNIINAPGSGGFDTTGGGANGLNWTWTGSTVDADGKISGANVITLIGTDLRNDHPIGIAYCGGGVTTANSPDGAVVSAATVCNDKDFKDLRSNTINTNKVWWVDSGTSSGVRDKGDMVLYSRTFANNALGPSVECASCHDPHISGPNNPTFLRLSNAGSAVCLACHSK